MKPLAFNPHARLARARSFALLMGMLLLWSPCAFALNPLLPVAEYGHAVWKRGETVPSHIYAIAQTSDGYLWLGGEAGLFQFDGVKFLHWEPPSGQPLPATRIQTLLVTRDDALWIGTSNGLAKWRDGTLKVYPELSGVPVTTLLEDRDGTVWVAPYKFGSEGELCAIRRDTVRCNPGDGRLGGGAVGLYQSRDGYLWAGVVGGLWRWTPGPPVFYPIPSQPYGIQGFAEDDDGKLLIGLEGRVARVAEGELQTEIVYPMRQEREHGLRLLRDRDGALWIGTVGAGLLHIGPGAVDAFAPSDGLSGEAVEAIFQDREGNVWVSTEGGLDRFRDLAVPTLSRGNTLAHRPNGPILASADGSIWRSARDGLTRLSAAAITLYRNKAQIPRSEFASNENVREVIVPTLPPREHATFFQDSRGRIWLVASGGVGYLQHDRFVRLSRIPAGIAYAIAEDATGDLWIAYLELGLVRIHEFRMVEQIPWGALGPGMAAALIADGSPSGLWLGFIQGGVAYFSDGHVRRSLTAADGLGAGRVYSLHLDDDGTLWVATEGGLSRIKDGRVVTFTSKSGLPCDAADWVIPDAAGSLWLMMPCGLIRVTRAELSRWASVGAEKDRARKLEVGVFDGSDGVLLAAPPGSQSPQVTKGPDGVVWFKAGSRVSFVDPRHLPFNRMPPPVQIEQVLVDGTTYGPAPGLRLPPRVRDVSIFFTAPSLVAPEKVRFRYKLEGQDADWKEVVNDRRVQYSNLSPGAHRFRVTASNNSGVWNDAGATFTFTIAPALYQTIWFRALGVAAVGALLWVLHQRRLRQIAYQLDAQLQERLNERTRIARELHDTLLQSFHGIMFRLQAVRNMLPGRTDEAIHTLETAILTTERAIGESRDAIQDLRSEPSAERDLGQTLAAFAKELGDPETSRDFPTFRVTVEGAAHVLSPLLHDEICRIARELIRNAFRHASARRIEAEIRYDDQMFCLRIRDDGTGVDPQLLHGAERAGHWGLRGIRERADRIGARLDWWSHGGAGTEVQLQLPAAVAYESSTTKSIKAVLNREK